MQCAGLLVLLHTCSIPNRTKCTKNFFAIQIQTERKQEKRDGLNNNRYAINVDVHAHANQRNNITSPEKLHTILNKDVHCLFSIKQMSFFCVRLCMYMRFVMILRFCDINHLCVRALCTFTLGGFAQSVFNYPNHNRECLFTFQ